jgi:predicted nucleotidyltransferase
MGNIFNQDFKDFIQALTNNHVKYILVGGYSVILHGHTRTTGDLDIWVEKSESNYELLKLAFNEFGLSLFDMTKSNFLTNPQLDVFTFGRPPVSIDIITSIKGCVFEEVFKNSFIVPIEGIEIRLIHLNDLLIAKKAANRPKDNDDINHLEDGK